ncbi:MAG: metallophosphoesterase [Candidatus Eremiobacteraeota bacterium]|nr:metallophosphoesterase [Candidatus Eremiobacteraeota bacterium]
MKIIATSDVHIPKYQAKMSSLARRLSTDAADVLLLLGDIAPVNDEAFDEFLCNFSYFTGPKLFVTGNHDIWTVDGSSRERYEKTVPAIVEKHKFHPLDKEPIIYRGVGFVGNIGWYDYTFSRVYAPPPNTQYIRYKNSKKLSMPQVVKWEELSEEDWKKKEIYYRGFLGLIQGTGCNDKDYIKDFWEDKEFSQMLQQKLEDDLRKVSKKADKVVAAFHCLPFKEGLIRDNARPNVCFTNAFAGSKGLGDVLYRHPKVAAALWGHIHHRQSFSKGVIRCVNVSFDPQAPTNPVLVEV